MFYFTFTKYCFFFTGYIDASSGNDDIEVGTKLELPCWMVKMMKSRDKTFLNIQIPVTFKEKYRYKTFFFSIPSQCAKK